MKKVSIGEYLSTARLAKDLTVEEVSVELKIPMQYITVMEHNQFQFLTKEKADNYLKSYADFLALDSQPLLKGYEDPDFRIEVEEEEEVEPILETQEQVPKMVEPFTKWSRSDRFEYLKNPKRRLPLVLMSLLTILLLGLMAWAVYLQISDEIRKEVLPRSSLKQASNQVQAQENSSSSDSQLTAKTKGSNISVSLAGQRDQVTIEISQDSDQENLVSLTNSDLDKKGITLDSNTKETRATLKSDVDKSVITLARTDNVTVKINGQDLDLSGLAKDNTSYITLTVK
ncbi:helix-turn-helix domain-containing protein [Streptococcus downei]|uniref:Membrane protein n=1 Tax=Streptococcus downei MFe28 TaxID=764290 RepID=A0A380JBD1_STRDO|nr:helix-turn-helix domain-containing protein [Streptococcus downei]EFQ56846.1 hypothetical protein HMPREF9176_0944 [Streptococcus downei F0415]SUN35378.1 membrane protein [Streptococcus downei MFe28]